MRFGKLKGRRIAILATDGVEQVELTIPRAAWRAAGATVEIVSLRPGKIRAMNLHLPGRRLRVQRALADADPADYDALFVPGGFINPDLLRQSDLARSFARAFALAGKPIASLCHGPWVLASAGLVSGRHLTSWPGIRDDLVHAGAIWHDAPVVHDRGWVTSRGPQDLPAFVRATIDLFAVEPLPSELEAALRPTDDTSDPPANAPPKLATAPFAFLTVPRVLLGAVMGAAAIRAARRAA